MKLESKGETLRVSAVRELGTANANAFRDWVRQNLTDAQRNVEIDLSSTTFLDSCGLGALVTLYKTAQSRQGVLRLIDPQPQVQQLLELTRLDEVFQVVKRQALPAKPKNAAPATSASDSQGGEPHGSQEKPAVPRERS